ncbi:MAG TPA: RecX family transcriptional regulator [Stellaceae bacterium]|nr:RecX family transcriptional regulator [Stellaceae bacterium]
MAPRTPRRPPAITDSALEKSALFYLERYAASSGQLRRVLLRRVKRAEMLGVEPAEAAAAREHIAALIARFVASGLLDDRRFAEAQAQSLQRRGTSRRRIRQRLAGKGVDREFVDDALETMEPEGETSELAAACVLARRRRLGPYRTQGTRREFRQKDLATLARAGFSLDVARRVLAAHDREALERLMRGAED